MKMYDSKLQNRPRREARTPEKINQARNTMPVTESTTIQPKEMPPAEHQAMQQQQPGESGAGAMNIGSRSHESNESSSSSGKPEHHPAKSSTGPEENQAKRGKLGNENEAEWEVLDNPNDPVRAEKERKENEAANKLIDDLDKMFRPSVEGLENWKRTRNR